MSFISQEFKINKNIPIVIHNYQQNRTNESLANKIVDQILHPINILSDVKDITDFDLDDDKFEFVIVNKNEDLTSNENEDDYADIKCSNDNNERNDRKYDNIEDEDEDQDLKPHRTKYKKCDGNTDNNTDMNDDYADMKCSNLKENNDNDNDNENDEDLGYSNIAYTHK